MRNFEVCNIITGETGLIKTKVAQNVGNFPLIVEFEVTDVEGKTFRYGLHANFSSRHERLSLTKISCTDAIGEDVCTECHNKPTYSYIEHDGIGHPGNIVACSKCKRMYAEESFKASIERLEKNMPNFDAVLKPPKGDTFVGNNEVRYGSE